MPRTLDHYIIRTPKEMMRVKAVVEPDRMAGWSLQFQNRPDIAWPANATISGLVPDRPMHKLVGRMRLPQAPRKVPCFHSHTSSYCRDLDLVKNVVSEKDRTIVLSPCSTSKSKAPGFLTRIFVLQRYMF